MRRPLDVLCAYAPHDGTLWSLFESRAAPDAQRPFLWFAGETISYAQFRARAIQFAQGLAARGIARGDRVAVLSVNSANYVALLFALARLGAVMVPVNPEFGAREAGYILQHAGVRAVAASGATLTVAGEAALAMSPAPWIFSLEAAAAELAAGDALARDESLPQDTCLMLYTSGTTGFPKGVMHSQRNVVLAGEGFVARLWLQPEDRLLCVLPMFHVNALFYSLAGALAAGASLALAPRFSASTFWQTAVASGATQVNIIAAVGNILARRPRSEFDARHRLRAVYGAPVSPELERVFRREFGVRDVLEGYGMTEIPGAANNPFDGERRPSSLGKAATHPDPAVSFAQLRIVDDAGRDLPDGAVGEIWVKTPILMQGYYRDAEQTAASIADGWFRTGDLAWRDADGYFYFVARKKDIIRRRGENISGAEIDGVIGDHPAVLLCAAIPVPSELGEDDILVAIVKKPGAAVSAPEIAAWCRARLAAIKVPRYVAFVDSLPTTATQRVQKFQLRNDPSLRAHAVDLGA
jgi:crotonobetaine/carnitine-CoA ligase